MVSWQGHDLRDGHRGGQTAHKIWHIGRKNRGGKGPGDSVGTQPSPLVRVFFLCQQHACSDFFPGTLGSTNQSRSQLRLRAVHGGAPVHPVSLKNDAGVVIYGCLKALFQVTQACLSQVRYFRHDTP